MIDPVPGSWPWQAGELLRHGGGFQPLLACWEAKNHPAQIRMQAYLKALERAMGVLPATPEPLALRLDVDVGAPERLLQHSDLENYLTPVIQHLGPSRFVLAEAQKRVGGGSHLWITRAVP